MASFGSFSDFALVNFDLGQLLVHELLLFESKVDGVTLIQPPRVDLGSFPVVLGLGIADSKVAVEVVKSRSDLLGADRGSVGLRIHGVAAGSVRVIPFGHARCPL